ncbi:hypothetical protein Poli38472_005327 [Pythium oligandrum]|uniref:Cytochrome P450 n=1 Tax=Pythium oligandrum TaxID=41045 RepID=A0A8K1CFT5_PYTOL|nr:hypothetical protein Poli38472_005327 [Pythium oligandrum]|eukprot:TMW62709.1 hypothetical protein Poli38472_005327 [Pythium oligandrum]
MVLQSLLETGEGMTSMGVNFATMGLLLVPIVLKAVTWLLAKSTDMHIGVANLPLVPPSTLPIINNLIDFVTRAHDIHHWLISLCEYFGGRPFVLRVPGQPDLVILSTPESVEDVMKKHFESFPKGEYQSEVLRDLLGYGLVATDGETWFHQRKVASNLFTARTLRETMTESIRKHTILLRQVLDKSSRTGEPVDVFKLLNRFTMEAFAEIGFGINMNSMEMETEHPFQTAFDRVQRLTVLRFIRPRWFWKLQKALNIGAERQLFQDMKTIDRIVLDIITQSFERRQTNEKRDGPTDIVSLFLDQYENSPEGKNGEFDPQYLRDIVVNFLIAGRDTTAQALSWFFMNMTLHPHVLTKIRTEIKDNLPQLMNGTIDTPTMDQVQQLTYLEAALKESLRLYPVVPFSSKLAMKDIVLSDGTLIREGQTVGFSMYANSRMKFVWGPDATVYNPGRWIDASTGKLVNYSAYKFFSFNAGPRICLGMNLAMLEMKIVVASLVSRLNVEVLEPEKLTYEFSLTLPVKGEMRVRVTPHKEAP